MSAIGRKQGHIVACDAGGGGGGTVAAAVPPLAFHSTCSSAAVALPWIWHCIDLRVRAWLLPAGKVKSGRMSSASLSLAALSRLSLSFVLLWRMHAHAKGPNLAGFLL